MRKFFSVWLILLVIVAFAAVLLVSYPLLTVRAQTAASDDLNVLLSAAFTRISLAEKSAEAVAASADENIIGKARAIDRFLSHDDALLQTDALVVLCEMLHISSVDVTDMDGNIVASSVPGRIGRNLVSDTKTAWTDEVLAGENLARTLVDEDNAALLSACVSRTDTEGLIYMQSLDVAIMEAMTAASPAQVLLDMSFIKDQLAVPDADGAFDFDGSGYVVTRTQDGVTLSAMRPFSQVYAVRSAVLLAEVIGFLLCMLFAAVIQTMLIRKRLASQKDDAAILPIGEADALETERFEQAMDPDAENLDFSDETLLSAEEDAPAEIAYVEGLAVPPEADMDESRQQAQHKAGRKRKPRKKLFEFVEIEEEIEVPDDADEAEAGVETEPQEQPKKEKRRKRRGSVSREDAIAESGEEADFAAATEKPEGETSLLTAETEQEAAIAFAAPQAVISEPAAQEGLKKHRRNRLRGVEDTEEPVMDAIAEPVKPRRKGKRGVPMDADDAFDKIFD